MKVVAIIPARAGSVRLPKKNRRKLLGKPLINWTIGFAKKLKFVKDTIVSTNDKVILKKISDNKSMKVFIRPEYLAKRSTNLIDAVIYDVIKYEKIFSRIDAVLLLQPTSPIRSTKEILRGFKKFKYFNRKKSIISVSQTNQSNKRYFEIKSGNLFLTKKRKKNNYYQVNGNFFFATPSFLKKYKSFYYKEKTFPVIIKNKPMSIDIDTLKDFKKVEKFLDLR